MSKGRVLIVDDDEAVRESLASLVEYCGYDVVATDSALDFVEQLGMFLPDIVVVDLILPKKDGIQLIGELESINPQAGIILISGAGERVLSSAAYTARERGLKVIGTLSKPFSLPELRSLLNSSVAVRAKVTAGSGKSRQDWIPAASDLQTAIEEKQISVVFQPQINTQSHLVCGFECLARWHHPEHGNVPPDVFVAVAEQSMLIDDLSFVIFEQAVSWFNRLTHTDLGDPRHALFCDPDYLSVSVNISAKNLHIEDFPEQLLAICKRHQVSPERVTLEITESSAMYDNLISQDILTRLRMSGFQLSIDDFGTGYSSMLQLVRMPFTELKVDKSFVLSVDESAESREVVTSIVSLARSLNMRSVAEGVETETISRFLRTLDCDCLQGFLFCKPMAEPKPIQWLIDYYQQIEQRRVKALRESGLLNGEEDQRFQRIVQLAHRLFDMPIVLFSLVDKDKQIFKARVGVEQRETARKVSFCTHTLTTPGSLVVNDASQDERFRGNPLVTGDMGIRFYSGTVIHDEQGNRFGTLCLIAQEPRTLSQQEEEMQAFLTSLLEQEIDSDPDGIYDSETHLLIERQFQARIEPLIPFMLEKKVPQVFLMISIVDFDEVTDDLTKSQWREIRSAIARTINDSVRQSDWLGHVSKNEFGVLLIDTEESDVHEVIKRFYTALKIALEKGLGSSKYLSGITSAYVSPSAGMTYFDLVLAAERKLKQQHLKS